MSTNDVRGDGNISSKLIDTSGKLKCAIFYIVHYEDSVPGFGHNSQH